MTYADPMPPLLHDLAGTWQGTGHGRYPTIESFTYREIVVFSPVPEKPILAYRQRTWSDEGRPLHAEAGFFRFGNNDVELVIAQPTGIAETHRGTVTGNQIQFAQTGIALTPTAVEVEEISRTLRLDGDVLTYRLDMAAVGQPLAVHLEARLARTGSAATD